MVKPRETKMQIATTLTMQIGRKHYPVASLADASAKFCAARDKSGFGASRTPTPRIFEGDKQIAYISYNGRVWAGSTYQPDATPLCEAAA